MRPLSRITLAILISFAAAVSHARATELYVAPLGNDAWDGRAPKNIPGTDAGPLATLEAARDLIRSFRFNTGIQTAVTVHVAPGTYTLAEPFALNSEDSGSDEAPITYTALHHSNTRLLAGRTVTGFGKVTAENVLARLDPAARGQLFVADLKEQGITEYGQVSSGGLELFFNGEPMQLSRWPNEGFVRIADLTGGEEVDVRGTKGDRIGKWIYEGDRPSRWLEETDAWLNGYWFWDWSSQYHSIKRIYAEHHEIEVDEPYHGYGYRKGQWYYALNLLAEIDRPGEWYLDRDSGLLYFWPPADLEGAEIFVSLLPHAVVLDGASHITLRGFTVEGARSTVIRFSEGSNNRIEACTIRNSGSGAITISGGADSGAVGCDIYNVGGGGIALQGGDRNALTPSSHYADNNHIHDYARWDRMYHAGISLQGVGNRASHNLIHDAPHIAIIFGGNDHLMAFNEIHSVCYESNDAGAIYAGRDWTTRGTRIEYNYMHHITGFEGKGCVGVYLDDMFSGTITRNNLFHKVYRAAFIGGGRDNVFENNLFLDCPSALHIDNRAMNWAADHIPTTMTERLNAMPFRESPWKERYPELLTVLDDEPAAPKGNKIERNVFVGDAWNDVTKGAQEFVDLKQNLVNEDPRFATPDKIGDTIATRPTDFALAPDSPAYALGFEDLPLEKMGLINDDTRASWPPVHTVRPVDEPMAH